MKDFIDIRGYENFTRGAHTVLIDTLAEMFSAEVRMHFKPTQEFCYYGVDITINPSRDVYKIDQNRVLLLAHTKLNDVFYYLGIKIEGNYIGELTKLLCLHPLTIDSVL